MKMFCDRTIQMLIDYLRDENKRPNIANPAFYLYLNGNVVLESELSVHDDGIKIATLMNFDNYFDDCRPYDEPDEILKDYLQDYFEQVAWYRSP